MPEYSDSNESVRVLKKGETVSVIKYDDTKINANILYHRPYSLSDIDKGWVLAKDLDPVNENCKLSK